MTFEYWALFQRDDRPTRIVVTSWDEMKATLDRLVLERGPIVWLIR